ncbi:MAG: hypothetical protein E6K96_06230 [Thaumarchaeota archaeon]|nr:MAG: hypothetical protein E6K96_06230 [Nitrososphaerota archaeon]
MNSQKVWLGFARTGGRLYLDLDELHPGIDILGNGADDVAAALAYACREARLKVLVLDLNGRVSEKVSGHFEARGFGYFLYDAMRLEEKASFHAELAASAYTMALNLSFEQEGFLNSAIQSIALEEGVASPASLADQLNLAGEFRGHTADELKGKLGALKSLNLTGETDVVEKMMEKSSVAVFASAESQQAAEVAMMLFLSKVLALGASGVALPDVLIVNEANRVFSNLPLTRHSNRLLIALLSSQMGRVFSSEATYGLDHHFLETAPVRILSSAICNEASSGGRSPVGGLYSPQHFTQGKGSAAASAMILTPNLFLLHDSARGLEEVFVPRRFEASNSTPAAQEPPRKDDKNLVKQILEVASSYSDATRASIVSYLSLENPREEIERAIDRLQSQGHVTVVGTDVKRDSPLHSIRLTQSGKDLLKRLTS